MPDAAVFKGDLDQVRTVAEQEEPESEPKADAIRGAAGIVRRFSQHRQKLEVAEAKRVHEEKMKDQMEPIGENEQVEWDGLRRRKTTINGAAPGSLRRQKTIHPPLGMAHFPDDDPLWDAGESRPASTDVHGGSGLHGGFLSGFRRKSSRLNHTQSLSVRPTGDGTALPDRPITTIATVDPKGDDSDTAYHGAQQPTDGAMEMGHVLGLPHGLTPPDHAGNHGKPIMWANDVEDRPKSGNRGHSSNGSFAPTPPPPPHSAKRQFSFQNVFHRKEKHDSSLSPISPSALSFTEEVKRPTSRLGMGSRGSSKDKKKLPTEEERLGLVKGDSTHMLPIPDYSDQGEDDWELEGKAREAREIEVAPLGLETSRTPLITGDEEGGDSDHESRRPPPPNKNSPAIGPGAGGTWKESEGKRGGDGRGEGGGGGGPAFI